MAVPNMTAIHLVAATVVVVVAAATVPTLLPLLLFLLSTPTFLKALSNGWCTLILPVL